MPEPASPLPAPLPPGSVCAQRSTGWQAQANIDIAISVNSGARLCMKRSITTFIPRLEPESGFLRRSGLHSLQRAISCASPVEKWGAGAADEDLSKPSPTRRAPHGRLPGSQLGAATAGACSAVDDTSASARARLSRPMRSASVRPPPASRDRQSTGGDIKNSTAAMSSGTAGESATRAGGPARMRRRYVAINTKRPSGPPG